MTAPTASPALGPSFFATLVAFIRLGRPKFLVGGFVLYAVGAVLAAAGGAGIDWKAYLWGQLVVSATQLATHYSNDYFDLEADRANRTPTRWSGGSRILVAGAIPPLVALFTAVGLTAIALVGAMAVERHVPERPLGPWLTAAIVALAWQYSSPPLRLAARGLGELTTATVVTLLVPVYGFYLQRGALEPRIFLAAVLPSALQIAMLLAIEFPDAVGDAAVGKRTLVVRLGAPMAARLYAAIVVGGFGALPLLARAGLPASVATAPLVLAPFAVWQAVRVARGAYRDSARWESVATWSVGLLIASAGAELVGALILLGG